MVKRSYDWKNRPPLEDHTQKKHKILKEYFKQYLITRCQHLHQESFKMAIIDGFSGGGLYSHGEYGSPLIFLDTLRETTQEINISRSQKGFKLIKFNFLIIFIDRERLAINELKTNLYEIIEDIKINQTFINIEILYNCAKFENSYSSIKNNIVARNHKNVFFNLDQCGYSQVTSKIIKDIIFSWSSAEVLLTFMIGGLLTYISDSDSSNRVPLEPETASLVKDIISNRGLIVRREWLGEVEKIVFNQLKDCANYVSPFSINNPNGWRYWLMHFANNPRARQVYNNLLHSHEDVQAHFGRPGLNMLSYDPGYSNGTLYLFDQDSRESSIDFLMDDIPRMISRSGKEISVEKFYQVAYSATPAHSDDIDKAIIENSELEVITGGGGVRRSSKSIKRKDIIKLKPQRSLIFLPKK